MEIITTKKMLEIMKSGECFSMTVVSYNRQQKTGGQLLEYLEAELMWNNQDSDKQRQRPPTSTEAKQDQLDQLTRKPNHHHWYTRNIRLWQNGAPTSIKRKFHPPLVLTFNGLTVVP